MLHYKASKFAIFAAVCSLSGAMGSAQAQVATEWSNGRVIDLGGLPSSYGYGSVADSINDAGQVVGYTFVSGPEVATEWSGGHVILLGALPGRNNSAAESINAAGQAVG
jgi:uncharacterized membrane protein